MIVSLFAPQRSTKGSRAGDMVPGWTPWRWETSWCEFVETLRDSAALTADPADKLTVMALACSEFAPGTPRAKANVIGCDLLGFDFDDKCGATPGAWTFDPLVSFMEGYCVPYLVHTTASCREASHCLRLYLPLDRRVLPNEFPQVWRAFSTWLGSVADESTKDESRMFFEPRRCPPCQR